MADFNPKLEQLEDVPGLAHQLKERLLRTLKLPVNARIEWDRNLTRVRVTRGSRSNQDKILQDLRSGVDVTTISIQGTNFTQQFTGKVLARVKRMGTVKHLKLDGLMAVNLNDFISLLAQNKLETLAINNVQWEAPLQYTFDIDPDLWRSFDSRNTKKLLKGITKKRERREKERAKRNQTVAQLALLNAKIAVLDEKEEDLEKVDDKMMSLTDIHNNNLGTLLAMGFRAKKGAAFRISSLTELDLTGAGISEAALGALMPAMVENADLHLRFLNLSHNKIEKPDLWYVIFSNAAALLWLKTLDISGNTLGLGASEILGNVLIESGSALTTLIMSDMRELNLSFASSFAYTWQIAKLVMRNMPRNNNAFEVDTGDFFSRIAKNGERTGRDRAVDADTGLRTLDMRGSSLGAGEARKVAELLKAGTGVPPIDYGVKDVLGFERKGVEMITPSGSALEVLLLDNVKFTKEGMDLIAASLADNKRLQRLVLRSKVGATTKLNKAIAKLESFNVGAPLEELELEEIPEEMEEYVVGTAEPEFNIELEELLMDLPEEEEEDE